MNMQITPYENVIIVGCGDIGLRVAQRWQAQGARVSGLVASDASEKRLELQGVAGHQVDLDGSEYELPDSFTQALVYYFVPPRPRGTEDSRCQHLLTALDKQNLVPKRIVAISTTGVYGDCGGDRISEDQPTNPSVDRARRRFDMESRLRSWCEQNDVALVILRVGGIYGPNRLPLKRIKDGIPVLKESLAPKTNRIHQEDLADICVAAAKVDTRYRVYNVSDGTDSNMTEYFYKLADHFHLPRPPAVDWAEAEQTMSAGMLSYLRESRRVDNTRMLKELGIKLRYPSLQQGLKEIDPESMSTS